MFVFIIIRRHGPCVDSLKFKKSRKLCKGELTDGLQSVIISVIKICIMIVIERHFSQKGEDAGWRQETKRNENSPFKRVSASQTLETKQFANVPA